MNRTINLPEGRGRIRINITKKDGTDCLSITGDLYEPRRPHTARWLISSGQIDETLACTFPDKPKITRLVELWGRWHLNDMRAGCAHQRALGWDKEPIDPSKPTTAYGRFGQNTIASWNLKGWLPASLGGHLGRACPECGYCYGTAWLKEELPPEVVTELMNIQLEDT